MRARTAPAGATRRNKLAPLVRPCELHQLRFRLKDEPDVLLFFTLKGATFVAEGAVWKLSLIHI